MVGQVDLEDSILPADHIAAAAAGNVDLVVGVGNPVRDILQVVVVAVVVGVLLFGVEVCRSQDEVVGVGVDHRIGIVEEDIADGFANLAVVEEVAVAGEAAAAAVEEEVVAVEVAAAAEEEVVEQLEVAAAAAVPGVAASDTAVAAAVKEEVLAVPAVLDFHPWEEESFAREPSVQEAHLVVVVALPMALAAAETEALPIAAAAAAVVAADQGTAAEVADLAAVVEAADAAVDLALHKENVHPTHQAVAVHAAAAYSANSYPPVLVVVQHLHSFAHYLVFLFLLLLDYFLLHLHHCCCY